MQVSSRWCHGRGEQPVPVARWRALTTRMAHRIGGVGKGVADLGLWCQESFTIE